MADAHDPRRAVQVDADVAVVPHEWLARVHAEADADGALGERLLRLGGRLDGIHGTREDGEQRVALAVDDGAVVSGHRVVQDSPVRLERLRVRLRPELVQQGRRTLDVREHHGHRALGQPARPQRRRSHGFVLA